MIKVFYGNDRTRISAEVKKFLGENYEVFDGENLEIKDIINIFKGGSLFAEKRKILLRDPDDDFYEEIAKYADTEHDVVIWETKLSQKKVYKDFVKKNKIEEKKFDIAEAFDARKVFGIFDTAMVDGAKAVKQLEEIGGEDPYRFFGLLVSQAIKRYDLRGGRKEKAILKELAKVDIQLKTTTVEPWFLIKSFLIRMSNL